MVLEFRQLRIVPIRGSTEFMFFVEKSKCPGAGVTVPVRSQKSTGLKIGVEVEMAPAPGLYNRCQILP